MKAAGWGDGFSVVLAGSNDRYPSDAQVTQAVGQMLARAGIRTGVQTMPAAMLFSRGAKLEFRMMLSGWVGTGEAASPLVALLATYDAKTGLGASNRGRWSNPAFDAAPGAALRTLDDTKRNGFFARAAEIAVEDMGGCRFISPSTHGRRGNPSFIMLAWMKRLWRPGSGRRNSKPFVLRHGAA